MGIIEDGSSSENFQEIFKKPSDGDYRVVNGTKDHKYDRRQGMGTHT